MVLRVASPLLMQSLFKWINFMSFWNSSQSEESSWKSALSKLWGRFFVNNSLYSIFNLTDRSWETERIVARWPSHPKFLLRLKRRFIYIIQFAKVIWSHDGHFGSFGHFLAPKMNFLPKAVMNYRKVSFWAKLNNK